MKEAGDCSVLEAIRRGYARCRGFSSHDSPANVRAFVDTGEFAVMLVSYNWLDRRQADTIAYAAGRGLGVSVMNPVGGGHLAAGTPQVLRLLPGARSAAELALRFVLATPGVAAAFSGMSTPAQLAENLRVAGMKTPLSARQRAAMLARLEGFAGQARLLCTACGYCTPCPSGVDIPQNFLLLSRARLLGLLEYARTHFSRLRKDRKGDHSALACTRCGTCLPKCPNNIPIIEQLAETARLLENQPPS